MVIDGWPTHCGQPALAIRRVYYEDTETWWFSVIDVVQVLTESKSAKRYWSDLKRKLALEAGSEQPYEEIVRLKLTATDGKQRETDCAKAGGGIARQARRQLESQTGKSVVSAQNYLAPVAVKALKDTKK